MDELKPCPFCQCSMEVESNRDWHRLVGRHEENCVFDTPDPAITVPADDQALAWAITVWNTRAASGGDSESGCVTFNVIKEVADTLISLGISVPEGNEEKAARANDLIRQLCQSIRSYLAATCQSQEPSGLVWDAFEALEDTPFGEHASAKHFIRPYLQGGNVLGWRMVDGIRVFGIVPASGLLPRQEFVRYDDHLATLAKRSASGGDVAIKGDRSFTSNLEEPASLEQRARDALSGLIHSMADIVNVTQTDAQFDADVLPRNPVMDAVAKMRQHWDELSKFITAALANHQGVGTYSADYVLPCDVRVHPATTVTKGCTLRTLMQAITLREGACALCGLPKHGNGESCPDPASFSLVEALTHPAGDVGQ